MKRMLVMLLVLLLSVCVFAQKKDITKTGWNFGFLPVVAYNSDLGFQYGVLFNIGQA